MKTRTSHLSKARSIIGGSVARHLEEFGTYVFRGVSWSIKIHQATGSATLSAHVPRPKVLGGWGLRIKYRCRPYTLSKANRWATLIIRNKSQEESRCKRLTTLDSLCRPLISNKRFMGWVIRKEKTWGESDYNTMTAERIDEWIAAVDKWKLRNRDSAQ